MTPEQREEIKELIQTFGWELLKKKYEERRQRYVNELIRSTDISRVAHLQERIQAVDELLLLPHQLLKEGVKDES